MTSSSSWISNNAMNHQSDQIRSQMWWAYLTQKHMFLDIVAGYDFELQLEPDVRQATLIQWSILKQRKINETRKPTKVCHELNTVQYFYTTRRGNNRRLLVLTAITLDAIHNRHLYFYRLPIIVFIRHRPIAIAIDFK